MSRYCEIKTQFKDRESLILALMETGGWTREQIEVHDTPVEMRRWGREKIAKANLIIRKKNVGQKTNTYAFNDIGFVKDENGQYQAIISDIDRKRSCDDKWLGKLTGNYAFRTLERDQRSRGRSVSRTRSENGRQRIEISGYR